MEFITISRIDDPTKTRQVATASFRRWPTGSTPGTKAGGAFDWAEVTEDRPIAAAPIRVPPIIEEIKKSMEDMNADSPKLTAAEVVEKIEAAETSDAVDAIVKDDERKTVQTAADKRKAQLARA